MADSTDDAFAIHAEAYAIYALLLAGIHAQNEDVD